MAEMIPLDSSNLAAVGFDETIPGVVIQFHNGASYAYPGTNQSDLNALLSAASPGQFFQRHFKSLPFKRM